MQSWIQKTSPQVGSLFDCKQDCVRVARKPPFAYVGSWPRPNAYGRRVSGGSIDRQVCGIEIDFA